MENFKNIDIGKLIHSKWLEENIEVTRTLDFIGGINGEIELEKMFQQKQMDTETLLRWSKLLKYDFFRVYSHHLMLYAPQGNINYNKLERKDSKLPRFRKNIYTREIIDFVLDVLEKEEKTKNEIIMEYGIPKTTLYNWARKYGNKEK